MTTTSTIRTEEECDRRTSESRVTEINGTMRQRFFLADPRDVLLLKQLFDDNSVADYLCSELTSLAGTPVTKCHYNVLTGEGWIEFHADVEDFDSRFEEDDYE